MFGHLVSERYWKQDAHRPLLTGWVNLSYLNLLLQKSHAKVRSGLKLQTAPDWHGHHVVIMFITSLKNAATCGITWNSGVLLRRLKKIFGERLSFLYLETCFIYFCIVTALSPPKRDHISWCPWCCPHSGSSEVFSDESWSEKGSNQSLWLDSPSLQRKQIRASRSNSNTVSSHTN